MSRAIKYSGKISLSLVLALEFILRFALFLYASSDPRRFVADDDSFEYIALAQHLKQGYLEPWDHPYPWKDELMAHLVVGCFDKKLAAYSAGLRRPPGYPLFLALIFKIFGDKYAPVISCQILLSLFTVWLTYRLGRVLFGEVAALLAAFVLAMDPISILYAHYFLTETLFTLVLAIAILWWKRSVQDASFAFSAFSGIMLGACILIRPIASYLPLLMLLVGIIYHRGGPMRRLIGPLWFLLWCLALAGGWMIQNRRMTGTPVLSTIEGKNYLYYRAAGVIAIERRIPLEQAQLQVHKMLIERIQLEPNPARLNQMERSLGTEIVLAHP